MTAGCRRSIAVRNARVDHGLRLLRRDDRLHVDGDVGERAFEVVLLLRERPEASEALLADDRDDRLVVLCAS